MGPSTKVQVQVHEIGTFSSTITEHPITANTKVQPRHLKIYIVHKKFTELNVS